MNRMAADLLGDPRGGRIAMTALAVMSGTYREKS